MVLVINGVSHNIPTTVSELTLGQFIEYYNAYGKKLDEEFNLLAGSKEEDAITRELNLYQQVDKEALCWFTHFTGFDFFTSTNISLVEIITAYHVLRQEIKNSEVAEVNFPVQVQFNNETFVLSDYKINPESSMTFSELLTGKEIIRQILKLGAGKWEALQYLCAIYLRKESEAFTDSLVKERLPVMLALPLNEALKVSFFLTCSINTFKKHFLYLHQEMEVGTIL